MRSNIFIAALFSVILLTGCKTLKPEEMGNLRRDLFYLPSAAASQVVSVTTNGVVAATILV